MPLTDEELEGLEPRELLQLGIELFNAGWYFDSHEAWEAAWIPSERPLRFFYQGLIQVAAAFVHLTRNEYPGTDKLLTEALAKLERFRPDCMGIDVNALVGECLLVYQRVRELGPKHLDKIPQASLPRILLLPTFETRFADIDGGAQRFLKWEWLDPAVPIVVLLHSSGLVSHVWQPLAAHLSPAYRVIAPELPGHGLTPSRGLIETDAGALEGWMRMFAHDALVVVEAGSGGIATKLAGVVGAQAVALRDLSRPESDASTDPRWSRDTWPGRWDIYRALHSHVPFDAWRPDVLWTYVEEASALLDVDVDTAGLARGMTEEPPARLLLDHDAVRRFDALSRSDVASHTIPASPFSQPEAAAEGLMKLLGRLT